jgi:type I restriction enzyme S subunit
MEVKPGYKQTEVGVIPEEWETSPVRDVCGCIVPGRNKPKLFDGDIPWITTPDLEDGTPVTTSRLNLCISRAEAKSVGSKVVPPGSVLMSCAGELGIVALTQNEIVVNQQLHAFLPTARIDGSFLLNALAYQKAQIAGLGTKTAVPYLNKNSCNAIRIPLPPLPEQRAIAEALGDVDALLGALDRLIAKKRDLKQAAMQQLLTGQTRLPGFEGEWAVAVLGDLLTMKATYGIVTAGDFKSTGVPMMRGGDIKAGQVGYDLPCVSSEKSIEYSRTILKRDDVVIALVGYPGEAAKVPTRLEGANISRAVGLLRLNNQIAPDYLASYLNSPMGRRMVLAPSAGSAQLVVNLAELNKLEFPLPPLPEQTAIAEVLSDMDAELAELERRRDKTRMIKQGMMQELLTGRTRLL